MSSDTKDLSLDNIPPPYRGGCPLSTQPDLSTERPSRLCTAPGCYEPATVGSRCASHARAHRAQAHASLSPLYQTRRWRRLSARFLGDKVCIACERDGYIVKATETDHIVPHHGDPALFWDESNWQPLCRRHHSMKTYTETLARRDA